MICRFRKRALSLVEVQDVILLREEYFLGSRLNAPYTLFKVAFLAQLLEKKGALSLKSGFCAGEPN